MSKQGRSRGALRPTPRWPTHSTSDRRPTDRQRPVRVRGRRDPAGALRPARPPPQRLADAGLINRRRSEGRRRRHYLTLNRNHQETSGPDIAAPGRAPRIRIPQRVLFVCTANTARSHLAAALWRRAPGDISADSAGTHPRRHPPQGPSGRYEDVTASPCPTSNREHSTPSAAASDLLITVCDRAHEGSATRDGRTGQSPTPSPKGTDRAFDTALEQAFRPRPRPRAPVRPPLMTAKTFRVSRFCRLGPAHRDVSRAAGGSERRRRDTNTAAYTAANCPGPLPIGLPRRCRVHPRLYPASAPRVPIGAGEPPAEGRLR